MKKTLSVLLSLSLVIGLVATPVAAASADEVITTVQALGVMQGDQYGDMNLEGQVTRAQFATMAVRTSLGGDNVSATSYAPFPDVAVTHWSASYVTQAVKSGYISGYTDGTFRPDNQITLVEGITVVLNMLGYTYSNSTSVGSYREAQMTLADQVGLLDELGTVQSDDILTRQQSAQIFYNALTATTSAGQVFLNTLGYATTSTGDVDLTAIINGTMEGPVVATGDWASKVGVNWDTVTVSKDGTTITTSQISEYDVLYWSENLNTLWVYSDRVSGTVQAISPSTASPAAVVVAGQTYSLSSSSAVYALSQLGQYGVGDTVTLLLGRDGTVVDVVDPASTAVDRVGVVTAIQKSSYDSGAYTADSITILATDGKYYSYAVATSYFDVGDLARISVQQDGSISLTRPTSSTLSGTVSQDGTTLGKLEFASNVEIIDTYDDTTSVAVIYPSRLAGVTLTSGDVRYYATNDEGQITALILDDVTGDIHDYAIITEVVSVSSGVSLSTTYSVTYCGVDTVLYVSSAKYTSSKGPAIIEGGVSDIQNVTIMSGVEVSYASGTTVYSGTTGYAMADDVQIYEKSGVEYYLTTLERAQADGLTLTAYYDKLPSQGGLVRIIVAE